MYRGAVLKSHPVLAKGGKFTMQAFFIRSAEMASLQNSIVINSKQFFRKIDSLIAFLLYRRVQSKINVSNRMWWAKFKDIPGDHQCSPLAPFLLRGNYEENKTCAITSKFGREFFCQVPDRKICENNPLEKVGYKVSSSTVLGTLLREFQPDKFYEHLSFE